MNVIPTVGVIIIKDKKVLLVKHGEGANHVTGIYGWPGGRFTDGETVKQAAVRELREETGLIVKEEDLEEFIHDLGPAEVKRKNGGTQFFSVQLFVCDKYSGSLHASDETTPEWVKIDELDNYTLLPNVKRIVRILSKVL